MAHQEQTGRADHCFLFDLGDGRQGIAFCTAPGLDREAARRKVEPVLGIGSDSRQLAYLGLLDYGGMDSWAGSMLGAFKKHDPVWLAYFYTRS